MDHIVVDNHDESVEESKISAVLLRLLFRRVAASHDACIDAYFEQYCANGDDGFVKVDEVFETLATAFRDILSASRRTEGMMGGEDDDGFLPTEAAQTLRCNNRSKYGLASSVSMNYTGRRVRARVKAVEAFCIAMHGGDNADAQATLGFLLGLHFSSTRERTRVETLRHLIESIDEREMVKIVEGSAKIKALLALPGVLESCSGKDESRRSRQARNVFDVRSALRLQYLVNYPTSRCHFVHNMFLR